MRSIKTPASNLNPKLLFHLIEKFYYFLPKWGSSTMGKNFIFDNVTQAAYMDPTFAGAKVFMSSRNLYRNCLKNEMMSKFSDVSKQQILLELVQKLSIEEITNELFDERLPSDG